jgi:hypothetical protein
MKWAIENGSELGHFSIKYLTSKNRFLVASQDLKIGDNISTIPAKLILFDENPLIKPVCEKYQEKNSDECIKVYLFEELKNPKSFFKPFFDYLPNDFETYPSLKEN